MEGPTPTEALEPGEFTLHAHCHQHLRELRSCMRELNLSSSLRHSDPFALAEQPGAERCKPHIDAWQACGRLYLDSVDEAHKRCHSLVNACKKACGSPSSGGPRRYNSGERSDECIELERKALSCLVTRLRHRMTTGEIDVIKLKS